MDSDDLIDLIIGETEADDEEESEDEEEGESYSENDLKKMDIDELKEVADALEIKYKSTATKSAIVKLILDSAE